MCDFSHLHCHTQYSLLDGAAHIKSLVSRASEMGMAGLAITDHGNLYGVPEFYTTARKSGVKPIIGCEFYITPSGMTDKSDRTRYHQVLLAKNEEGYRHLIKLSSLSYTDGYYYKPRIDKETLKKYSAGLVATTCCLQGEVLQTILQKGEDAAKQVFERYLDIFGEDYYIEIQDHGIEEQRKCNAVLLRWAEAYGVKVIATNDVHYVEQNDSKAQDVLLCLQTGKDLHDPNRMRFENDQFFLKSTDDMRAALTAQIQARTVDAMLDATREIVDKCAFELPMGTLLMPHFPLPPAFAGDMDGYLRHLVYERAPSRYGEITEDVRERLDLELEIIKGMGFAGYFLIVQDFTTAARELGVTVGPGRGSAAGSAVAYCLGITNIDPLKYDLLFERFLNPERVSMPDVDIDFDDRGRGKVIDYVVEKYGRANVCQIITFGTMGAKSVIKDVSRVLGIPLEEANRISGLIPDGPKVSLQSAREEVPEFRALFEHSDPQIRQLLQFATVLEGSARHTGVHAAGVIIAPGDVSEYVPVAVAKSKGNDVVTTQYDGSWVESFGLLKMDFLGLKTLTIINDTLDLIAQNHGHRLDPDEFPLDDRKTFELFQRGDTVAIFQFESSGMREYMVQLKPTCLDDLIAMNALYRPGPMDHIPSYIDRKHGREKVKYPHPMLEPILRPTYGIPVYQEQVMQMAQVMGGYTLGGADLLRRAMGKKKAEEMAKHREIFRNGAAEKGVDAATADAVFDLMEKFAGYGFNKCVTGDTEIIDAHSGRRVRVLDVVTGQAGEVFVASLDEQRLKIVPRRVVAAFSSGQARTYRLRTRTGRTIRATDNHPIYTPDGWTHLGHLQPGNRVAVPRHLPYTPSASLEPHELVVLGYALSEGNLCHPHSFYVYSQSDEEIADYVTHLEQFANTTATIDRSKSAASVYARRTDPQAPAEAAAFVEALGLKSMRAVDKRLPEIVFQLPPEQIALLLGRMWTGDGCVHARGVYYATSSERLARDVQHLLLRLGLQSTRYEKAFKYRDTLRPGYAVRVSDKEVEAFAEKIGPYLVGKRKRDLDALLETRMGLGRMTQDVVPVSVFPVLHETVALEATRQGISMKAVMQSAGASYRLLALDTKKKGYSRETIATLAHATASEELKRWAESDVYWDEVVAIEETGVEEVYDLTVEDTHNFVAGDLIVHNSHAAAYSVVAYQTAYLKAHYPAEFMAAVMTSEMGAAEKLAIALDEARRMDLRVLPPDINRSSLNFTVEHGHIRFALSAIKGVGTGAVESLLAAREKHGAFTSLFNLCAHADFAKVNKKTLECLAAAGAFDGLGGHRAQMAAAVELAVQEAQRRQEEKLRNQMNMFGGGASGAPTTDPPLPMLPEWSRAEKLKHERDLMGFYVSGHPLDEYAAIVHSLKSADLGKTEGLDLEKEHRFCGLVTDIQRRTTKTGRPMGFVTIEDYTGQGEIILFTAQFEKFQSYLQIDEPILVRGQVEVKGGHVKILANDIAPMWKVMDQYVQALVLKVNTTAHRPELIQQLFQLCDQHRGRCKLYFEVSDTSLPQPVRLRSRTVVVDPTPEVMRGMTRLFGMENVRVEAG